MKILHYSLGFPPFRTGGMTKFCMDLMLYQKRQGHEAGLLWPGEIKLFNKATCIKRHKRVQGIDSFEIINPILVSYDEGISDIDRFTAPGPEKVYQSFFNEVRPDVLHVHTFMGMHSALLKAAKAQGIRIVFTTHDFFPICPKVTMFREGQVCPAAMDCSGCASCNSSSIAVWKLILLQSSVYRRFKEHPLVKRLRKQHRDSYLGSSRPAESGKADRQRQEEYKRLRQHYNHMLELTDVIHFNSSVTQKVYESFLKIGRNEIIPITHSDIADKRKKKDFHNELRITYLGAQSQAKGFYLLRDALDLLEGRKDFVLTTIFEPVEERKYIRTRGRYTYEELEGIFDETDILVVPSIWYETFGYTALEAISFGCPVLATDHVGAKDIIPEGGGIITGTSKEEIADAIMNLTGEKLGSMNLRLLEKAEIITMDQMCRDIMDRCYLK